MRRGITVGVVVVCAAAPGCGVPQTPHEGQVTSVSGARPSAGAGCGEVPDSTGPLTDRAELTIAMPTSARAGEDVTIIASIRIASDAARVISSPADSAIFITKGGQVVGRSPGTAADYVVPIVVKAGAIRPAQALPTVVRMSGCSREASEAPLPAGHYELVGVLGYRSDAFNAAAEGAHPQRKFVLVSAPVPITVR